MSEELSMARGSCFEVSCGSRRRREQAQRNGERRRLNILNEQYEQYL